MKELVCISGKGGTGKTSIVASFASLTKGVVLADCDVDAPDLHLILKPRVLERHEFKGGMRARIEHEKCNLCGTCRNLCRFEAVTMINHPDSQKAQSFLIDPVSCEGCGVCVHFCPQNAIRFEEVVNGEWFISDTRFGPLVHATLGVAEENSGKLVTVIRTQSRRLAEEKGLNQILVDGSPGIGCPVIASLTGADLVLIVTEPTLSGFHDLDRVVSLTGHFQIPVTVCINKADINPSISEKIEQWCRQKDINIIGRIPYDPDFTNAQIEGKSLVEYSHGLASQKIRRIWKEITDQLDDCLI